jgi:hypothetical protein
LNIGSAELPVAAACGGCASCRLRTQTGWFAQWPETPAAPWPVGAVSARLLRYMHQGRVIIEREDGAFDKPSQRRFLREFMNSLWDDGMRKFFAIGAVPDALSTVLAERPWCTAMTYDARLLSSSGLPTGPAIIWASTEAVIPEHQFFSQKVGEERLFLIPVGLPNPDRPGRMISDLFPTATFNHLYESLQT